MDSRFGGGATESKEDTRMPLLASRADARLGRSVSYAEFIPTSAKGAAHRGIGFSTPGVVTHRKSMWRSPMRSRIPTEILAIPPSSGVKHRVNLTVEVRDVVGRRIRPLGEGITPSSMSSILDYTSADIDDVEIKRLVALEQLALRLSTNDNLSNVKCLALLIGAGTNMSELMAQSERHSLTAAKADALIKVTDWQLNYLKGLLGQEQKISLDPVCNSMTSAQILEYLNAKLNACVDECNRIRTKYATDIASGNHPSILGDALNTMAYLEIDRAYYLGLAEKERGISVANLALMDEQVEVLAKNCQERFPCRYPASASLPSGQFVLEYIKSELPKRSGISADQLEALQVALEARKKVAIDEEYRCNEDQTAILLTNKAHIFALQSPVVRSTVSGAPSSPSFESAAAAEFTGVDVGEMIETETDRVMVSLLTRDTVSGNTMLHTAAEYGALGIIELLLAGVGDALCDVLRDLDEDCLVDMSDEQLKSWVGECIALKDLQVLLDQTNESGLTALEVASSWGQFISAKRIAQAMAEHFDEDVVTGKIKEFIDKKEWGLAYILAEALLSKLAPMSYEQKKTITSLIDYAKMKATYGFIPVLLQLLYANNLVEIHRILKGVKDLPHLLLNFIQMASSLVPYDPLILQQCLRALAPLLMDEEYAHTLAQGCKEISDLPGCLSGIKGVATFLGEVMRIEDNLGKNANDLLLNIGDSWPMSGNVLSDIIAELCAQVIGAVAEFSDEDENLEAVTSLLQTALDIKQCNFTSVLTYLLSNPETKNQTIAALVKLCASLIESEPTPMSASRARPAKQASLLLQRLSMVEISDEDRINPAFNTVIEALCREDATQSAEVLNEFIGNALIMGPGPVVSTVLKCALAQRDKSLFAQLFTARIAAALTAYGSTRCCGMGSTASGLMKLLNTPALLIPALQKECESSRVKDWKGGTLLYFIADSLGISPGSGEEVRSLLNSFARELPRPDAPAAGCCFWRKRSPLAEAASVSSGYGTLN